MVVITGASSGIARATALRIAELRGTLVLASRQENALRELANECERRGGGALAVATDVTSEEQVRNLADRAVATFGRIDAWVNAAAVTMLAKFEDAPPEAFRRILETNFFGSVHGARAVLPRFRQQGHGVLINIASVLGKVGSPYASAYVASKFAVTGFSESLRMELRDTPQIQVCTILPATIDTPLFQHAANYTGRAVQALPPVYTPGEVAQAVLTCIERPRREVTVGNVSRLLAMRRVAPPLAERLIAAKVRRQHFQDKPAAHTQGNMFEPMSDLNCVRGGWGGSEHRTSRNLLGLAFAASAGVALWLWYDSTRRRSPMQRLFGKRAPRLRRKARATAMLPEVIERMSGLLSRVQKTNGEAQRRRAAAHQAKRARAFQREGIPEIFSARS